MKRYIFGLLLFVFASSVGTFTFADHKCPKDKVCIPVGSLSLDPVAKSLRIALDRYANHKGIAFASAGHTGVLPYLSLFREKFIVLEIREGEFGGYWINLILSPSKMTHLLIWVYDIGEDEYEIRYVKRFRLSEKDRKSWKPLSSKEYIRYWL